VLHKTFILLIIVLLYLYKGSAREIEICTQQVGCFQNCTPD